MYMTQKVLSHHLLLIQVFMGIYYIFEFLFAILVFFQNKINLLTTTTKYKYSFSIFVVSFVYYLLVTIFVYYPYKEFKKIYYKKNPALERMFANRES